MTVELERAVLESLRDHVAVLDSHGNILTVNQAWENFAQNEGLDSLATVGVGCNYLEVCRVATVQSDPYGQAALAGLESVIDGSSDFFELEYPCHSPTKKRWFHMTASRLRTGEGGVVVVHRDITDRKQAQHRLGESADALRQSQEKIRELAGRLIEAQEAERKRIASELHDDLNQKLAALSIALSMFNNEFCRSEPAIRDKITELRRRTDEMSDDVRHLSHRLHPAVIEHVGLAAGLRSLCREFAKDESIHIELEMGDLGEDPIPSEAALCLYRVAQEGLRNIMKHAEARKVRIELMADERGISLSISDDGKGFDAERNGKAKGLGLVSMEERLRQLGGAFQIETEHGQGTKLLAKLPVRERSV